MSTTQTRNGAAKAEADLEKQISALKSDVASLTETLAEYGRAQKALLGENAQETINGLSDAGAQAAELARQNARDAYAGAEKAVRANPATSVGIAVGAGFLAGLLASRR